MTATNINVRDFSGSVVLRPARRSFRDKPSENWCDHPTNTWPVLTIAPEHRASGGFARAERRVWLGL